MNSISGIEKRRHKRFPVEHKCNIVVKISYMGEDIKCKLVDISLGGAGLKSDRIPFSPINNTILMLEFSTPTHSFKTQAKVVYSQKDNLDQSKLRYGTQFSLTANRDVLKLIETIQ